MGSAAGKSMNIPMVYAEKHPNVCAFRYNLKQSQKIPELLPQKLTKNYVFIEVQRALEKGDVRVVHGLVGLKNLDSSCYFNTAIQCLSHTQPLQIYFLSNMHEKEINKTNKAGSKGVVANCFAELILNLWHDKRSIAINTSAKPAVPSKVAVKQYEEFIVPAQLLSLIQKYSGRFERGKQEDCQELLSYLLDMIHEDLNRTKKVIPIKEMDYVGAVPKEEWAVQSWQEHLKLNSSIIVDSFQGQLRSSIKCVGCGYQSHKFEPFLFLNLPVKQEPTDQKTDRTSRTNQFGCTLEECLEMFQKEELLEGGCQWYCPTCKSLKDAKKSIHIWKLPDVLIIHLKRFQYSQNGRLEKTNTLVEFPLTDLDMSGYCYKQPNVMYSLYAVAMHQGTLQQGHYHACCKNRLDDNWYLYNDEAVFQIQDLNKMIVNNCAYVLFYQRHTDKIMRQTISNPGGWLHNQQGQVKDQCMLLVDCEDQKGQLDLSPLSPQAKQSQSTKPESVQIKGVRSPQLKFKGMTQTMELPKDSQSQISNDSKISKLEQEWGLNTVDQPLNMRTQQFIEAKTKGKFLEVQNRKRS